ncbi:ATP-binding cassette domain-containing protein [Roseomonas stagni]|uniref:ATP-binding cassette domain-containing protein n=1 Tax=Falsiroseomonas algicola TaxID=2716930 RepID=A0A6M1LWK9_9PROT|nr:ATP-binding cassette domain-containing protein [Falsiroseomonas algicola]NGM24293.1 ATP-binding cassette domain-containing protein [Falsiroseomonas algicola]
MLAAALDTAKPGQVPPAPILALTNAVKLRGSPPLEFRLEIPSFIARAGEFIAVVGESGCGKSTLLDLLALISRPSDASGFMLADAECGSHDISALWRDGNERALSTLRARSVGYVLQTGGLLPFLTVGGNAELSLALAGRPLDRDRIRRLAENLGIEGQLRKKPYQLSGGQRQRAAILRALAHNPRIVLADEPTAAVDKTRAGAIVADFRRIAMIERTTVIMVTHDLTLVDDTADRRFGFRLATTAGGGTVSTCVALGA